MRVRPTKPLSRIRRWGALATGRYAKLRLSVLPPCFPELASPCYRLETDSGADRRCQARTGQAGSVTWRWDRERRWPNAPAPTQGCRQSGAKVADCETGRIRCQVRPRRGLW